MFVLLQNAWSLRIFGVIFDNTGAGQPKDSVAHADLVRYQLLVSVKGYAHLATRRQRLPVRGSRSIASSFTSSLKGTETAPFFVGVC